MTLMTDVNAVPGKANGLDRPIIETVGLVKTYPGTDFRAVDELNLHVNMGEV